MVRFNLDCHLAFPATDFWRIRCSPSFLRFIVADGMLKSITATEEEVDEEGWSTREQTYCPMKVDCPDFIRGIVGDTLFKVNDAHRWKDSLKPCHLSFQIQPSFLSALSTTRGELSVKPFPTVEPDKTPEEDSCVPTVSSHDTLPEPSDQPEDDTASHSDLSEHDDSTPTIADKPDHKEDVSKTPAEKTEELPPAMGTKKKRTSEAGSEIESAGAETETDNEQDTDSSDDDDTVASDASAMAALDRLPAEDKSVFNVVGQTRVRILTLGWFVERAIVHNMRLFYKDYPATVYRFRCKLYRRFADGDTSVPISVVVDRLLQWEADQAEEERVRQVALKAAKEQEEQVQSSSIEDNVSSSSSTGSLPSIDLPNDNVESRCAQLQDSTNIARSTDALLVPS